MNPSPIGASFSTHVTVLYRLLMCCCVYTKHSPWPEMQGAITHQHQDLNRSPYFNPDWNIHIIHIIYTSYIRSYFLRYIFFHNSTVSFRFFQAVPCLIATDCYQEFFWRRIKSCEKRSYEYDSSTPLHPETFFSSLSCCHTDNNFSHELL